MIMILFLHPELQIRHLFESLMADLCAVNTAKPFLWLLVQLSRQSLVSTVFGFVRQ